MSTSAPLRSLSVCQGRDLIGHILEVSPKKFLAQTESNPGATLGPFKTQAEAAAAIDIAFKAERQS